MFQPNLLFKADSYHPRPENRKKDPIRLFHPHSSLLAEGERVTATSLDQRRSSGGKSIIDHALKIIHRVPSVEGATATSLDSLNLMAKYQKINRKNAPNELSTFSNNKKRRIVHGA